MHRRVVALFLAAFISAGFGATVSPRYSAAPIAQLFTEREIPGSPYTRTVAVHPSGLIYVANVEGLAEYDGVAWRLIPGTSGLIVHNLAIDADGRLWYSAKDEFGVLAPDETGQLVARPLQEKLPSGDRAVGHVLSLVANGREAFFATQGVRSFIVRADAGGAVRELALPNAGERCRLLFAHEGQVFAITSAAVYRIEGDELAAVPEAQSLSALEVRSVWPRAAGGAWIVSAGGLRVWHGADAPLASPEAAAAAGDARVLCGCPLADGRFALGTDKRGLLIVDAAGRRLGAYDETDGLGATSNTIGAVTPDAEGGVWLSLLGGVTRVQLLTPAVLHNRRGGVRSRVEDFVYHRGKLHVATTEGVFVRDPETGAFTELPSAGVDAWQLLSTDAGLIVAGADLRLVRDDGTVEWIDRERLLFRGVLRWPGAPERLVASTGPGLLRVYRREGGAWRFEGGVPAVHEVMFDLARDAAGWLWAASRNRRDIVRLDWRKGVQLDAAVESMGPERGLPAFATERKNVWLFLLDGLPEVSSSLGLWRFDPAADRFVPEQRVAGFSPARWSRVYPLAGGALWLANAAGVQSSAIARPTGAGEWRVEELPYTGFESIQPRVVFDEPATETLWIGYQGLASFDRAWHGPRPDAPVARVRRVATRDQKTIWAGSGVPPAAPLGPEKNSLQFTFAALSFRPDAWSSVPTEYRTRLDGFDREWSAWGTETRRDYTNLPPGKFSLQVQARDGVGREGPVAEFAFVVQPPWWRTWWCVGLAAGSIVGAIVLVTRWYSQRVLRRRLALVEARAGVERERLRLARDLHDEVGSGLGRVMLFADEAERESTDRERLSVSLRRVRAATRELAQQTREIVWAVSPQHDTLASVAERLGDYVEETLRAAGIRCRLVTPLPGELPAVAVGSEARHSLFLAVKESVHNCVKHAGAADAEFSIAVQPRRPSAATDLAVWTLAVTLRDFGCGFVVDAKVNGGHGLRNLAARAAALGGTVEIASTVGQGTTIAFRVPLAGKARAGGR